MAAAGYYLDGHVVNMRAAEEDGKRVTAPLIGRPDSLGCSRARQVSHRSIGRLRTPRRRRPCLLSVALKKINYR
jgi:hypothetical protein